MKSKKEIKPMKFNISYPLTGGQKTFEVDDDKRCSIFYDRRMGAHIPMDTLGDNFKGYIVKITGGNDREGFPMRQGIIHKGRVRILMGKGQKGYRPRRTGELKRKSIRGCIVGPDIRVLALQIVKKGDKDLEGLTNVQIPRRLGPKRLTRLRRLYGFKKTDGVALIKKNIIRRTWNTKDKDGKETTKKRQKAPKIQRLVTDTRLRRKQQLYKTRDAKRVKNRQDADAYKKLIAEIRKRLRKKSSEVVTPKETPVTKPKEAPKVAVKKTATGKQAPQPTKGTQPAKTTQPVAKTTQPKQQVPAKTAQPAKPAQQPKKTSK